MKIFFNSAIIYNHQIKNDLSKNTNFIVKNNAQLNSLECLFSYNLPFCSKPVYVIDYDGTYEKFPSANAAKRELGISLPSIIQKKSKATGSKTVAYANEIENKDGEVDIGKIKKAILKFNDASSQPIYAISFDCKTKKFNNIKEAAQNLSLQRNEISRSLLEDRYVTHGYIFTKAFNLELRDKEGKLLRDKNGNPLLDIDKLNHLKEIFLYTDGKVPLLEISKDGSLKIFQSAVDVAKELNCARHNIYQAISRCGLCQGKAYVRLIEMVKSDTSGRILFNEDGSYELDMKKIEEYKKETFANRRLHPRRR